jgi:hypothetical protein
LKRYFLYNTLAQNRINFSLQPYAVNDQISTNENNSLMVKFSYLLKSTNFANLNFTLHSPLNELKVAQSVKTPNLPLKDLKLLTQDATLFTLNDEGVLASLSSSYTSHCSTLFFYNNLLSNQAPSTYLDQDTLKPLTVLKSNCNVDSLRLLPTLQGCALKDLNFWLRCLNN